MLKNKVLNTTVSAMTALMLSFVLACSFFPAISYAATAEAETEVAVMFVEEPQGSEGTDPGENNGGSEDNPGGKPNPGDNPGNNPGDPNNPNGNNPEGNNPNANGSGNGSDNSGNPATDIPTFAKRIIRSIGSFLGTGDELAILALTSVLLATASVIGAIILFVRSKHSKRKTSSN